jgi:gamma-glutamylcyclotransferase (GGCT)/AIG2-like uncharacterized protein YtfP
MPDEILLFAYASWIQERSLREGYGLAHPQSRGRACLRDHTLCLVTEAAAPKVFLSINPNEGSLVWGRIWRIDQSDWAALSKGNHGSFALTQVDVVTDVGETWEALTYVAPANRSNRAAGHVEVAYKDKILAALRELGVPEDYYNNMCNLLAGGSNHA